MKIENTNNSNNDFSDKSDSIPRNKNIYIGLDEMLDKMDEERENLIENHKLNQNELWLQKYESLKIDPNVVYPESIPIIEIKTDNSYSRLCTIGNILTITGKPKSRKSFFLSLLIAQCIKPSNNDIFKINPTLEKRKIIFFDTEQSKSDAQILFSRIQGIIKDADFNNIEVLSLRGLDQNSRVSFIEETLNKIEDVYLVIIDSVRDLISDENNSHESTVITNKLMNWSVNRNIHIITVIHQNKTDNNAKGHVGGLLCMKSESIIAIEKKDEVSIVKPVFLRGKDFKPFAFGVNEYGTPYLIQGWDDKAKKEAKKVIQPENFTMEIHFEILKRVFNKSDILGYSDMLSNLQQVWLDEGHGFGNSKVRIFYKYYLDNGLIIKLRQGCYSLGKIL